MSNTKSYRIIFLSFLALVGLWSLITEGGLTSEGRTRHRALSALAPDSMTMYQEIFYADLRIPLRKL